MLLVAGITASVLIQTMNSLSEQALRTGTETLREVSTGLKVTHISGYYNGSKISQLALFIVPLAASDEIDLTYSYISLSDTSTKVILNYSSSCFSSSVSDGIFGTINASNLSASTYGILVVRDEDSSCSASSPTVNKDDLLVLLINTSKCFSGIDTRTEIAGNVYPEYGISGVIAFTTPSAFTDTIIDLQP
jgi:flagellin FlaB